MKENIKKLKFMFDQIKNKELTTSLRSGTTGIGYTFESLIGKKEDNSYNPDFNGIEIKTKIGYSKSPLTLFCLTPTKNNDYCIKYILNNFGYPDKKSEFKCFRGDVYCKNCNLIENKYLFKVKVDYIKKQLILTIKNTALETIDNNIYWTFEELKKRLFTKLKYLAFIRGFPYKKDNKLYYKYTSLTIYKLRSFECFLRLIEEDKIHITFNIGTYLSVDRYGQINDRGTAFRIPTQYLDELFEKICL